MALFYQTGLGIKQNLENLQMALKPARLSLSYMLEIMWQAVGYIPAACHFHSSMSQTFKQIYGTPFTSVYIDIHIWDCNS